MMKKLWNDILSLFYPNHCLLCRNPLIDGEEQLCLKCIYNLPKTNLPPTSNPVEQLLIDRRNILYTGAFFYYEQGGHVQKLIHSLKYYGNKELGYLLGRQVALEWKKTHSPFCRVDVIIPLPLHRRKQRQRGYNQSEWIANGIASVLPIPVDNRNIQRRVMNESQTKKSGYNRWLNVKDVFAILDPEKLIGKHILLVDDVVTTGATAGTCIDTISELPNTSISFFALSIAPQ